MAPKCLKHMEQYVDGRCPRCASELRMSIDDATPAQWDANKISTGTIKPDLLLSQEGGDHYTTQAIQPVEYIVANKLNFNEGNVVKYVSRHKKKNGLEDIKKCMQYLRFIAQFEYGAII